MSFNKNLKNLFITLFFVLFFIPTIAFTQNISLTIGDASGELGEKFVPVDVSITNLADTISGFQIWLQLDRPDIVTFQKDPSNNYLYDTANFIVPSWGADLSSLSGVGTDILITSGTFVPNGNYIFPSPDNKLLIRLYLDVVDTFIFPPIDSLVNIILQTNVHFNFSFNTPSGQTIGLSYIEYADTTCFECLQWVDNECLSWDIVPSSPPFDYSQCDSIDITLDTTAVLDSTYWQFSNGSFTLLPTCGYSLDLFDISNLVALVDFMFTSGPQVTYAEADFDCNCEIDISDLVGFVEYMFHSGDIPDCPIQ